MHARRCLRAFLIWQVQEYVLPLLSYSNLTLREPEEGVPPPTVNPFTFVENPRTAKDATTRVIPRPGGGNWYPQSLDEIPCGQPACKDCHVTRMDHATRVGGWIRKTDGKLIGGKLVLPDVRAAGPHTVHTSPHRARFPLRLPRSALLTTLCTVRRVCASPAPALHTGVGLLGGVRLRLEHLLLLLQRALGDRPGVEARALEPPSSSARSSASMHKSRHESRHYSSALLGKVGLGALGARAGSLKP